MKLQLTFPKTHKREDLVPIYENIRTDHFDLFQEWLDLERQAMKPERGHDETDILELALRRVLNAIRLLMRTYADCESGDAVTSALVDLRGIAYAEVSGKSDLVREP